MFIVVVAFLAFEITILPIILFSSSVCLTLAFVFVVLCCVSGPYHCTAHPGRAVQHGGELPGTVSRAGTGTHRQTNDREWCERGE